jgi:hypothetical protein
VPRVIEELNKLSIILPDLKNLITQVIAFFNKVEQHTYIKLIGD